MGRLLYVGYGDLFFLSRYRCIISFLAIIVFDPLVDRSLILSVADWAQMRDMWGVVLFIIGKPKNTYYAAYRANFHGDDTI